MSNDERNLEQPHEGVFVDSVTTDSPMDDHSDEALVRWLEAKWSRHHEYEDKRAAERLSYFISERENLMLANDNLESRQGYLRAALLQASFCLRTLLPDDPDAQLTVRTIEQNMSAAGLKAVDIRYNLDGSLDEVCAPGFHLEQMSGRNWWMAVEDASGEVHVNFHSKTKIVAIVNDEREPPAAQSGQAR
jgi:hypothetical protein